MEDIKDRENFVRSYNEALNVKDSELKKREVFVLESEKKCQIGVKQLDEKQAFIASKIAENEDILAKIEKSKKELENLKILTDIRKNFLDNKELDLRNLKSTLDFDKSNLDVLIKTTEDLKKSLDEKNKVIESRDAELEQKQLEINVLNKNIILQKRENDAITARIQRLITLNKLEQEALK